MRELKVQFGNSGSYELEHGSRDGVALSRNGNNVHL